MKYQRMAPGIFLDRPNRFIAHVQIGGKEETVHVKNTGRCRELLLPGAQVMLQLSDNPNRKTAWDLISVKKEGLGWVNMDSQAPNRVVREFLEKQPGITYIRPEYRYGDSRVDFYFERFAANGKDPGGEQQTNGAPGEPRQCLMEVKGVTLERDGIAYFPDAPTERGVKHILELQRALAEGYDSYLAFVIQMEGITEVRPNDETHPAFGQVLREAAAAGVQVLCLPCAVKKDSLTVKEALPCGLSL